MSDTDEDELVLPVPSSSHRFKRFGTIQFSDPAYPKSPLSSSLPTTGSLLAVSNRYGRLFLLSSSSPPALLVASTSAVLESVEADKREQAAEAEQGGGGGEGVKRESDAAASPNVFFPVGIAHGERVRHLSLSPDDQWLLTLSDDGAAVYHIGQFSVPTAGWTVQPFHTIELPDAIDVQWWPHQPSLLLALDRRGAVSSHQLTAQGVVEQSRYSTTGSTITSMCASTFSQKKLYLGHADGSLHVASLHADSPDGVVVEKKLPPHNPNVADFAEQQPTLHFIHQPFCLHPTARLCAITQQRRAVERLPH